VTENAGRLTPRSNGCRLLRAFLAECRPGEGRALVLADADLVRDELWVGEAPGGASRQRRLSDNPLVVADLLDRLAGLTRPRALGDARWADGKMRSNAALLRTLLPLLALAVAAACAALLLRRRRTR
jgi:integrase